MISTSNEELRQWLRRKNKEVRRKQANERCKERQKRRQEQEMERLREEKKRESTELVSAWIKDKRKEEKLLKQRQRQDRDIVDLKRKPVNVSVINQTLEVHSKQLSQPTRETDSSRPSQESNKENAQHMTTVKQRELPKEITNHPRQSSLSPKRITLPQEDIQLQSCTLRLENQQPKSTFRQAKNHNAKSPSRGIVLRMSFDEWLKRKNESDEKKRQEIKKKAEEAKSEPKLDQLVSSEARRRMNKILRNKRRVDTGIHSIDEQANAYPGGIGTKEECHETSVNKDDSTTGVTLHVKDFALDLPESQPLYENNIPIHGRPRTARQGPRQISTASRPSTAMSSPASRRKSNVEAGSIQIVGDSLVVTKLRAKSVKPGLPLTPAYAKIKYQQKSWDGFSDFVWNEVNEDEGGEMERPEPLGSEKPDLNKCFTDEVDEETKKGKCENIAESEIQTVKVIQSDDDRLKNKEQGNKFELYIDERFDNVEQRKKKESYDGNNADSKEQDNRNASNDDARPGSKEQCKRVDRKEQGSKIESNVDGRLVIDKEDSGRELCRNYAEDQLNHGLNTREVASSDDTSRHERDKLERDKLERDKINEAITRKNINEKNEDKVEITDESNERNHTIIDRTDEIKTVNLPGDVNEQLDFGCSNDVDHGEVKHVHRSDDVEHIHDLDDNTINDVGLPEVHKDGEEIELNLIKSDVLERELESNEAVSIKDLPDVPNFDMEGSDADEVIFEDIWEDEAEKDDKDIEIEFESSNVFDGHSAC